MWVNFYLKKKRKHFHRYESNAYVLLSNFHKKVDIGELDSREGLMG